MTKPITKVLLILKRNPSMTVEEFRHQYETVHAPWGMKLMPGACRYVRRYLRYVGAPHADVDELDFDVITECWYENEADAQACADKVALRQMGPEAEPRERGMFDGPLMRVAIVTEECDSDLGFALQDIAAR